MLTYTLLSAQPQNQEAQAQKALEAQEAQEEARKAASIRAQEVAGLGVVDPVSAKHKPNNKPNKPKLHASIVPAVALTILCVVILVLLVVAVFVWKPNVFRGKTLKDASSVQPSKADVSDLLLVSKPKVGKAKKSKKPTLKKRTSITQKQVSKEK